MQTLAGRQRADRLRRRPRDQRVRRRRLALFDAHQPYDMSFYRAFRFPWSGAPGDPAGGRSRASTTPKKRRSCTRAGTAPPAWPPGACSPASSRVAQGAGGDPGRAASRARRRCPASTPTPPSQALDSRRSRARHVEDGRRDRLLRLAAELADDRGRAGRPASRPAGALVGRFGLVLLRRRRARRRLALVGVELVEDEEDELLLPHPATATVLASTARAVSMAVSGVLLMGRAPIVARGLGGPPYQALATAHRRFGGARP